MKRKEIILSIALAALTMLSYSCSPAVVSSQPEGPMPSWWPEQTAPETLLECAAPVGLAEGNLAQSISGNVARLLNEGKTKEGVWIEYKNENYVHYLANLVERLGIPAPAKTQNVWELLEHFAGQGLIKDYVLYDVQDAVSVNVGTVRAGYHEAVLIDKTQEEQAKALGLNKVFDATAKGLTVEDNFRELKDSLNNHLLVIMTPRQANNKDMVIAHKSMLYYGLGDFFEEILEWVEPLSPVIGWNRAEKESISPCSKWGLVNTVSDHCMNLAILSSAAASANPPAFKSLSPKDINWKDPHRSYHSYLMSDGDNMQWGMASFPSDKKFWVNEYASAIPMGYTTNAGNMRMEVPDVLNEIVPGQQDDVTIVEYGTGYFYPDVFGCKRPNREELLRKLAHYASEGMKRSNQHVYGFICDEEVCSEDAQFAYQIFAEEIEDLAGIISVQYSPYCGGYGEVFWPTTKDGIEIPVATCQFQVWVNYHIKNSGTPEDVAKMINEADAASENGAYGWTVVHAWSSFDLDEEGHIHDPLPRMRPGQAGMAQGAPQGQGQRPMRPRYNVVKTASGTEPVYWSLQFINDNTKIVSLDELMWRMRMQHNPEQTKKFLK